MSVAEKIVYSVAAAGVACGGYQAVTSSIERSSVDDALEASIEQVAQVEAQYKKENPEATQMPVDVQEGPAEYRSLLLQQSDELTSDAQLGLAFGGIWAGVLVGGLMLGYRRAAHDARDTYIDATAKADARWRGIQVLEDEMNKEHFAKVAELSDALKDVEAYKERISTIWDEAAERNLAEGAALKLAIQQHVSETGTPQEKILETADEIYALLVRYRENPEAFHPDLDAKEITQPDVPSTPTAEAPVETEESTPAVVSVAGEEPVEPAATSAPAEQSETTASPVTTETSTPQPAPATFAVHRARHRRPRG